MHHIQNSVRIVTMLAILGGVMIPTDWVSNYVLWFALLLIIFGVPHGASDYIIFKRMLQKKQGPSTHLHFGTYYAIAMLLYSAIWWMAPVVAFLLFIFISAYHFGQSNWHSIDFKKFWHAWIVYGVWGIAVIGIPVLLHHEEASIIILEITGVAIDMSAWRAPLIYTLIGINLLQIVTLFEQQLISQDRFYRELSNFLLLVGLFATTPLLVGFGIYFMFWHSLASTLDQLQVFQRWDQQYDIKRYLKQVVPMTILAFVGLGGIYYFLGDQMNHGINLGAFFLFIAIITVPHSILMDKLYSH
ncbi:MAG: beta-carotene 15,15'-dioxygenase, Brp/Blh family [Saprospiraceae bacterium]|nr:beta-carotene 15,15'-dioxygenase, Brp/Blh family [Saprospiraceae bacterium]